MSKESFPYQTSLEKKIKDVISPFQEYTKNQVTASILLLVCTVVALIWSNIAIFYPSYQHFIHIKLGFHVSHLVVEKTLQFWVNDVLLTLFFFFVGLEIKREFLVGELRNHRRSTFILFSAVGGMLFPAIIYFFFNRFEPTVHGWGVPMATDTAFALGVLSCFKRKLPKGVFTFMAALAIIDDIGAIIVLAVFYTPQLNVLMLFFALLMLSVMLFMNYAGFRKPLPYLIVGLAVWGCVEGAGIHGTIAGVLIAFCIPARPEKQQNHFVSRVRKLLKNFEKRKLESSDVLEDDKQHDVLEEVKEAALKASPPLQRWESKLELPVALIVLPLFALVNVGVPFDFSLMEHVFTKPLSLGVLLGLLIGKGFGVILGAGVALKCKLGILPENTRFTHIAAVSILTGIGFTMSLFIANVAFIKPEDLLLAKAAILVSSFMAALLGIGLLCLLKER